MNHKQLFEALPYLMKAGIPAYITGPPGCGKSEGVEQFARSINYDIITESAVTYEPTDIKGLPGLDKETRTAKWFPPDLVMRLKAQPRTVLFWDDLPTAPPLVQASLFRCMLERYIGDIKLPDETYVAAAGNRTIDAAGAHQMPTPMRNRLCHIELEVTLKDWVDWALVNGIETSVIAFLRFKSELLYVFDKTQYAFPTLRTWKRTSDIMKQNPPPSVARGLVAGNVGESAAIQYMGYLEFFNKIPPIEAIIMNPDAVEVPKETSILYALATALARKASDTNMDSVVKYVNRMPVEFSVLTIQDAVARNIKCTQTRAYSEWCAKNFDVLA